ncbi:MAG: hypothetical protein ACI8RZ_005679 [Myxococcota bacterium]|jgi:hypothetical protein
MGLRNRIKGRIKKVIGREEEASAAAPAAPSRPVAAKPAARPAAPPPAKPTPPPAALSEEDRIKQEKAAKHMKRTRKGVLKFVADQGGTVSLADMHKHSEMRYFVGHQKFSKMMEEMISEGLLDYSHADGTGTITPGGRELVEG